jgi:SPX domain protein involved in polyphosphate accumulation
MFTKTIQPLEDLDTNWRYETKYRISVVDYYAIKNALSPNMKPDDYTQIAPMKRYLVRSLYFDTRNYQMYSEKIDGICNRIKFRIRTYGTMPEDYPDIRVEMKVRKGNMMEKHGTFVTYEQYQNFMSKRRWHSFEDPVLAEFWRYTQKWNLVPTTLVQYFREGFHSRGLEGIRLTFDHRISSAPSKNLFPENIYWRRHYHSQVVMEIKHKDNLPDWLNKLIHSYQLKVVPNSKYANSVEVAARDIVYRHH